MIKEICKNAKKASIAFSSCPTEVKNQMLACIAKSLLENKEDIQKANDIDILKAKENGKDSTFIDRLKLTDSRIEAMAEGLKAIIKLDDPVGEVVSKSTMYNGLELNQVRMPLGIVAIIYEARPNVTIDCAGLTIKSGNVVILRGSKDAINSNRAIYKVLNQALIDNGFDNDVVQFVDDEKRETTLELIKQNKTIDVIIPRGGNALKNWILGNSKIPVIASAGGNCHIYVEKSADIDMAVNIINNAKVQRPSVCNACEQVLVDREVAKGLLDKLVPKLKESDVEILGCETCCGANSEIKPASEEDYYTEHLTYKISIKAVDSYNEAIIWVNEHNTKHSESIISMNEDAINAFTKSVDAAAVYVNASTRFTDGFEFGLGAEMGISTQKLHVRGPIALKELTSTKYVIKGNGQIRE